MVFGLFDDKEAKLQQQRFLQEQLIAEQLKALQMEHELQRQTMTQKGLINQQKLKAEQEKAATAVAVAAARESSSSSSSSSAATNGESSSSESASNSTKKPPGPTHKIAQHMEMARKGYEQLVHAIVRPPRAEYTMSHLGPAHFTFLGRRFLREDTTLMTERGYRIQCSHWRALNDTKNEGSNGEGSSSPTSFAQESSVVVYMHGNASARVEVLQQLSYLLSLGTSVCSFDFAGSGMSDGDYVSLGYYEREDLASVVAHLRGSMGSHIKIALWGRSMGAATALMYASREATMPIQNVACLILDSSFCDLVQLAEEMVDKAREQGIGVPNVVVSVALAAIGWSVQNKAQFDIKDISPIQHAPKINVPALVVCGEQDDFIKPLHSEKICERYKGTKNLLVVQGDHNDLRPPVLYEAATQFLSKYLLGEDPSSRRLEVPDGLNLQSAPWQFKNIPSVFQAHTNPMTTLSTQPSTIDTTEIGMTKERQHAIQSSLVTMLGHEKEEEGEGEVTTKTPAASNTANDAGDHDQKMSRPPAAAPHHQPKEQGEEIVLVQEHEDDDEA